MLCQALPVFVDRRVGLQLGRDSLGGVSHSEWFRMNPLSPQLKTGTVGELLVQLRLLQYDVQSVPPHKDTGNDLLAVRGETFRALQVKTTTNGEEFHFDHRELMKRAFHILALVRLEGEDRALHLDQCRLYLLRRDEVAKGRFTDLELKAWELSERRVAELFGRPAA